MKYSKYDLLEFFEGEPMDFGCPEEEKWLYRREFENNLVASLFFDAAHNQLEAWIHSGETPAALYSGKADTLSLNGRTLWLLLDGKECAAVVFDTLPFLRVNKDN